MSSAKAVAFLAKKSWHTGTMQHMEKVWKAEQAAKAEEKKIEALKKELTEERELESLRRAHEEATGRKRKEKVEFLYNTPINVGPSAEDYLLGEKYVEGKDSNDVAQVQAKPGSLWLNDMPVDKNFDVRAKIREDPLYAIKQKELETREKLKNNPIFMKKLREKQLLKQLEKDGKKKKKKSKKRKHEHRDKDKDLDQDRKRKRPHDHTTDGDNESTVPSKRSRRSYATPPRPSRRTLSRSPSRRHRSRSPRRSSRSPPSRRAPRSRSPPRHRRSRSPPRRRSRSPPSYRRHYSRSRSPPRRGERSRPSYRRSRSPHSSSRAMKKKPLTEEERAAKLAEFQKDAVEHMESKRRIIASETERERVVEEERAARDKAIKDEGDVSLGPQFLTQMSRDVYNDKTLGTLEDRIKRNMHSTQRQGLDEKAMF